MVDGIKLRDHSLDVDTVLFLRLRVFYTHNKEYNEITRFHNIYSLTHVIVPKPQKIVHLTLILRQTVSFPMAEYG